MFGENFVQRADGGVHVVSMQNIRRQKTQHGVAGAVDDDVPLEHFSDCLLGQFGGVEFGGNHQAPAAHVNNGAVARGQGAELREEVVADIGCVSQQIFIFNRIDDGDGHGAG